MDPQIDLGAEWLEADGLGGFASGTVGGVRTRRYHALLLHATTPPTGRFVLVNGFDAWLETAGRRFFLSTQRYTPDVTSPDGASHLAAFAREPWPTWRWRLPDGLEVVQELVAARGAPLVALSWRIAARPPDHDAPVTLVVRPFLTGRDTHATHHENPAFRFDARVDGGEVSWQPYDGVPRVVALSNGRYEHDPAWYRNFQYDEERARGLDFVEDAASPGVFHWDVTRAEAAWIVGAESTAAAELMAHATAERCLAAVRDGERRRRARFASPLHRAAADYLVQRGPGRTIVAGYPWFSDWGRDTFIALRGLCIATGQLDVARDILLEWAGHVSEGMLPNYFPEQGRAAEYNSVDASLWFVIAAYELLRAAGAEGGVVGQAERERLRGAMEAILSGYAAGTRYGIRADADGLLAAGEPGVQLTWMDARVDGREITPRIGKPVEVEALWVNALRIGSEWSATWAALYDRARAAFPLRFWNAGGGYLYDVVDVEHRPGTVDAAFRPNQILAVGGLPFPLIDGRRGRRVADAVEARLWTPLGPRSLAPDESGYVGRYQGGVAERDGAYHQGTVWPWLAGPFVEAWVRVRGNTNAARARAAARFLPGLLRHLDAAGLGHVSEVADADPPHVPGGCPFQAWSLGELLRLTSSVLAPAAPATVAAPPHTAPRGARPNAASAAP